MPTFSQCAKFFPISVKTIAHCFALPKGLLEAREAVSALMGVAFEIRIERTQVGATIAATERCAYDLLIGKKSAALMWIERLFCGVLRVLTPFGPRYLSPSFLERVYLLWTFRNFTILPLVVLNHRQQRLVDRLCSQQKFVSLSFENGMFEQPLIGTVERLSPMHSRMEAQAEGALSRPAASGVLSHSSGAWPWPSSRVL